MLKIHPAVVSAGTAVRVRTVKNIEEQNEF
jgi:hypothetical protein